MKFTAMLSQGYSEFKFTGKPDEKVRTCLKGHGFRWNPRSSVWWKPSVTSYSDCLTGLQKLGCELTDKIESFGDAFDMAYEDSCARACGL